MSETIPLDDILRILTEGEMNSLGMMPWGSNYTFLVQLSDLKTKHKPAHEQAELLGVYKPRRGEAPLWDFPSGTLCLREYAAWLVSEALGWNIVPPTVLRNGENGFGSVQLFIDNDPNQHFFNWGARCYVGISTAPLRFRQRLAIHFPVRRQRHLLECHES